MAKASDEGHQYAPLMLEQWANVLAAVSVTSLSNLCIYTVGAGVVQSSVDTVLAIAIGA
ncbi:hypothetical protein ACODM8_07630 [Vibrio ostreicida]|uniref:Uncharacterized protein n=1 Tax=Vibrio ostreicida TaxID=526588 RepID=A0ABT8BPJ6_9VIBR|nr:hypothetical protein [Vibrio ostreicida]MDN3608853.1 hypothetical protein [Vibrio ostreicida]NPD09887.1 hypothetical protein [Vibrio ostreicida]